MKTGFYDRSGKEIYTDDIVLWRLGKFAKKSGGPTYYQVVATKKGPRLVSQHGDGWLLRERYKEYMTIVDTQHRELDENE